VREMLLRMGSPSQIRFIDPKRVDIKIPANLSPCLVPFIGVSGLQKNSISICSNSRDLKIKLLVVTSFLKAFPICAIPNGTSSSLPTDLFEVDKIPWQVSGRSQTSIFPVSVDPRESGTSIEFLRRGEFRPSATGALAVFELVLASAGFAVMQSTACHETHDMPACDHTSGCIRMLESIPTTSSRIRTMVFHHRFLTLFLSSIPSGPKSSRTRVRHRFRTIEYETPPLARDVIVSSVSLLSA